MLEFSEQQVLDLERFTRDSFQLSETTDAARQLKYMSELRRIIASQMAEPSDDLVRLLVKPFYPGKFTASVRNTFVSLVRDAFTQHINDSVDSRLNAALARVEEQKRESQVKQQPEPEETESEFKDAEIEACQIVKAILSEVVDVERVRLRRYVRHSSVLLDNSRKKVVCELRLRNGQSSVRVGKNGSPVDVGNLNEIYDHADGLKDVLDGLLAK